MLIHDEFPDQLNCMDTAIFMSYAVHKFPKPFLVNKLLGILTKSFSVIGMYRFDNALKMDGSARFQTKYAIKVVRPNNIGGHNSPFPIANLGQLFGKIELLDFFGKLNFCLFPFGNVLE